MNIDLEKYLIPLDEVDLQKVISGWTWLTEDKTIVALTKTGDALLKDSNDRLFSLDTGKGLLEEKAKNFKDFFNKKLNEDLIKELLMPDLIDRLELYGMRLKAGQVYSYTLLPILGGTYDETNMFIVDLYEHYNLSGDIHFQIKDLPNGTRVEIKVK